MCDKKEVEDALKLGAGPQLEGELPYFSLSQ
jgi:hypothetical protein